MNKNLWVTVTGCIALSIALGLIASFIVNPHTTDLDGHTVVDAGRLLMGVLFGIGGAAILRWGRS